MTTPGNNHPTYLANQFGTPIWGVGGNPAFTGNWFWVNETNGSDGNTGGPSDPFKTLTQALSLCTSGNNDVIFLTGTVHVTATVAWNKSNTHLIGLAPPLSSEARARISQTGATPFTPLVNVTGSECIFQNIGSFHGFANASTQICWAEAGQRNSYSNCAFLGMANATAAAQAGGRSLTVGGVGGGGENTFTNCIIGLDTIARSAANASLEFINGTPRNVFRNCIFPCLTTSASAMFVLAQATSMDRFQLFDNCAFINAISSTSTTMTVGMTVSATAGGMVVLNNPISVGATAIASTGNVYGTGPVPTGATSGLAVPIT